MILPLLLLIAQHSINHSPQITLGVWLLEFDSFIYFFLNIYKSMSSCGGKTIKPSQECKSPAITRMLNKKSNLHIKTERPITLD